MSRSPSLHQLQSLYDLAIQAAVAAGHYIQNIDRSELKPQFKQAGSSAASQIVSDVDIRSEAIIREHLMPASQELGIAFLGEESSTQPGKESSTQPGKESSTHPGKTPSTQPGERPPTNPEHLMAPYFWCVDPLDGTLPFVEGRAGYAVSIALVDQSGSPLIGVVYDPVDSAVMHAMKGRGAYLNGSSLNKERSTPKSLVVFADASFKTHQKFEAAMRALNSSAEHLGLEGTTLMYGSGAVKNACQVLQSSAACYLKLPKAEAGGGSVWDYAATACIASEAGAWVSNVQGQSLELNRRESNFMNHQGVLYASNEQLALTLIHELA